MVIGPEASFSGQSKIYTKQQPIGLTFASFVVTTEEVVDAGGLLSLFGAVNVAGKQAALGVQFTIANIAANEVGITMQLVDGQGQAVAQPYSCDVILSDAATGAGLTATTASGAVTTTTGTILQTYTAKKALRVQASAAGVIVLTITDTANTGFFILCDGAGLGPPAVSRQLVAGDYS